MEVEAAVARRLWRLFEPYHAVTYFSPECREAFKDVGLKGFWMGYFAGRAAPMGQVGPGVVTATFFGFHPAMVARALPDAWGFAPVPAVLDARLHGVDHALRRLLGDGVDDPALGEAARLARAATEGAGFAGRPLFAANAGLEWPEPSHLALWHAATLLREHRGDGHVAALLAAGLDGCSAHVTLVATGALTRDVLQPNRGWSDEDWEAAAERLMARGWLDDAGELTEGGRVTRRAVEDATDELALEPWAALGKEGSERLAELLEPVARAVAHDIPLPNPIGLS